MAVLLIEKGNKLNKLILLIVFILAPLLACDGDCMKCHPSLLESGSLDSNHKIMRECINCHQVSNEDLSRMGSLCGQDCWQCHNVDDVMKIKNKEHLALEKCISCHKKLDKSDLMELDKSNLIDLDTFLKN